MLKRFTSVTAEKRSYAKLKQTARSGGGAFPSSLPTVHLPVRCLFGFGVSFKITSDSWLQTTGSPLTKLVLMCLSDYADESGFCWPSMATMAQRCETSERSVRREIRKLELSGILKTDSSAGRKSNRYTISTRHILPGSNGQPGHTVLVTRTPCPGKPGPIVPPTRTICPPILSVIRSVNLPEKGEASPKLSKSQEIRLEGDRKHLRERIRELRKNEFRTSEQSKELKDAKVRVSQIDEALHIPLGNGNAAL